MPDLQNTKIIQWSPDSKHEDETFEFDIDGFGIQKIKVVDIPETIIDDFESENLSSYTSLNPGKFSITTNNVIESESAVKATGEGSTSGGGIYSVPNDGLNSYPENGDLISWIGRPIDEASTGIMINVDENSSGNIDGYRIMLSDNSMWIGKFTNWEGSSNGSRTTLNSDNSTKISINNWYWCEVRTPTSLNNEIKFSIYELDEQNLSKGNIINSITANDNDHLGRGIGMSSSSDGVGTCIDWIGKTTL